MARSLERTYTELMPQTASVTRGESSDGQPAKSLTACVLVPTFKRPLDLKRCIGAIALQDRLPDEVIVVVRDIDAETWKMVEILKGSMPSLITVEVSVPGQVQALNAGIAAATADIIAITDDDAAPHADWLRRIVAHFEADPTVGGVGGRDLMRVNGVLQQGRRGTVGRVPKIGRTIGNHHLGFGAPRSVDVLKGVNGSYRAEPLRQIGFDTRLKGTGAQVHWEIALGIAFKRRGWKLVYDPSITVDHYIAPRFDEDQRNSFNALAVSNAVFNETMIRLETLPPILRLGYMAWCVLLGTRGAYGCLQFVRFVLNERSLAFAKLSAALRGRFDALAAVTRAPRLESSRGRSAD